MPHCRRSTRLLLALVALVAALTLAAAGWAQPLLNFPITPAESPQTAAPTAPTAPAAPVVDERRENAELLRVAQRRLELGDPTDSAAAQEVALYQSLDAVFAQQEVVVGQIRDLEARQLELEAQSQTVAPEAEIQAAGTFVEFDALKDELAAEQARASLVGDKLAAAKTALEKAQRALDESETKRRQAQEAFETGKSAPNTGELEAAAGLAKQASKLAAKTLALRKSEVARDQLAQGIQQLAVKLCQDRVTRLSPTVVFAEADLQEQVAAIKKKEDSANKSLLRAQTSLQSADVQFREAQKEHEAETGDRTVVVEKLEAARRAREKLSDEIDSLNQRLQRLSQLRVAWNRRFLAASSDHSQPDEKAYEDLRTWQKETREVLDERAVDLRMQILRIRELRSTISAITKKVEAATEGSADMVTWLETQKSHVEAMLRIHESSLVSIENSRRVHEKLLDEIGQGVTLLNPKNLALGAWHQAKQVWGQEITKIDERSITVGKVITCVTVFFGGWMFAGIFSRLFSNRILKRFRLSKDATAAIRTLVFYSLLAATTLIALRTVNVPLTAFTIIGSAIAIGVGFGSQALVGNFIGGLIMLAERPVRLGERITFGNYDGVVEDVGFRCTKLRTANDHLVTIPNSTLINESIENVARRRTIRRNMNVAIPCDTPRDRVAEAVQAIRDVLDEREIRERIHPIVGFEEFPPRVHFNDMTAQHLNIQVVYWYAPTDWWGYMAHTERVNYRIMEELERLGIELASPSKTFLVVNETKRELNARVA
jgi:small-conductance mechanosensitive channel